jgi:hypothetical protein
MRSDKKLNLVFKYKGYSFLADCQYRLIQRIIYFLQERNFTVKNYGKIFLTFRDFERNRVLLHTRSISFLLYEEISHIQITSQINFLSVMNVFILE